MRKKLITYWIARGFTLVELLVVMAIIGILMGIGLPAFEKIMKGQGVEAGARGISGRLECARSYAITNNTYTAVLFPTSGLTTTYLNANYLNVQLRVCAITITGTSTSPTYTFQNWIKDESWYKLPTGTAFSDIGTTFSITVPEGALDDINNLTTASATPFTMYGIVFTPYGNLYGTPTATQAITIYMNNGGATTAAATDNKITLSLNSFTGRISYGE